MNKFGKVLITLAALTAIDTAINAVSTRLARAQSSSAEDAPDPLRSTRPTGDPFDNEIFERWSEKFKITFEEAGRRLDEAIAEAEKRYGTIVDNAKSAAAAFKSGVTPTSEPDADFLSGNNAESDADGDSPSEDNTKSNMGASSEGSIEPTA